MTNKTEKEFLDAYDAYAENVLKHIYFRTNNWQMAEDMTQETFLKTWDYIAGNKGKINNFKTFIYRIAHNLIVDHYRRKPRIPVSLETIADGEMALEPVQEKQIDGILEKELMEKCLAELDDDQRKILVYRYIDDLSIREISEITSRSENNVSVTIHRALKVLKAKIEIWQKKQE